MITLSSQLSPFQKDLHVTFGDKLKDLRASAGLSQSQLAKAAGIGLPTLKGYEGDARSPSLEIAQRLAVALGTTCQAFDGCEFRHAVQRPKKAGGAAATPAPDVEAAPPRPKKASRPKGKKAK